jgi:hypothetical protein
MKYMWKVIPPEDWREGGKILGFAEDFTASFCDPTVEIL